MEIFGWIGMVLVQGSSLFQIWRFVKTRETKGVSISFWWAIWIGLLCYLVYAISIKDIVYIASNGLGITLSSVSIGLFYYY